MDVTNTKLGTSVPPENENIDSDRRQALARLGLAAEAVYAVPTLLSLTPARASSSSGGGGGGGSASGGTDPTQPSAGTEPTSPSDSDDPLILPENGT
jgi:hypothetical protein